MIPAENDDARLEELLARYLEQRDGGGEGPDPRALCGGDPALAEQLLECIRDYERLRRRLVAPEDPRGRTLLHYRVLSQLGAGGMGKVYLAADEKLGRRVALKLLPPEMADSRERMQRFRREARAVAALNHPNVVTLYSVEEFDGLHFLVMERVEGETLDALIPEGGLEPARLLALAEPLLDAVAAAHARGIVHRDLKPSNVMLGHDGRLKVLDFGLAKLEGLEPFRPRPARPADPRLTRKGRMLGTLHYMSPEQVRGRAIGPRSDVFSLGVLLYEMSTGRRPFGGDTEAEVIAAILHHKPRPIAELRGDLPDALVRIVGRCLEKRPRRRYETARDLLAELAALRRRAGARVAVSQTTDRQATGRTVGREAELRRLRAGLDRAAGKRGLLLGVAGEPGIGKTTLIEDFLKEDGAARACRVARGRCCERLAGTEAYLPILEALADLLDHATGSSMAGRMRELAPWWFLQTRPAAIDDRADAALVERGASATAARIQRELAAFLSEISSRRPVILFFDDLHWSDLSTIDLLSYLASKFDALRLLIVAAYRPEEMLLTEHPFLRIRGDLQARGLCREIVVGFLSRAEIEAYLALGFPGHDFPAELARLIHKRTEGNPLFMVDLVRDLRDRGVLSKGEGGCFHLARALQDVELELPESVRAMIRRKIDHLAKRDRWLLAAASVLGDEFDAVAVARILAIGEEEVEERLQALDLQHALVRLVEERELPDRTLTVRYRFVHVLYQNVLFASLTPSRRVSWCKAAADVLRAHCGGQPGTVASELAVLSESARDFDRAAEYFGTAAHNTLRVFGYQETARLASRGLESLETLADASFPELELNLQLALGVALMATRGHSHPEVERAYRRARELCEELGNDPRLFGAQYGWITFYYLKGDLRTMLEQAHRLVALAERQGDVTSRIIAHDLVGSCLVWRGRSAAAQEHLDKVLELYDPRRHRSINLLSGWSNTKVNTLCHYCLPLWLRGYPEQALERICEALTLSRELSHPFSLALALLSAGVLHYLRRDVEAAAECARESLAVTREHGFPVWSAGATVLQGWVWTRQGNEENGIAQLRRGLDAFRSAGAGLGMSAWLAMLAEAYGRIGRHEQGLTTVAEALRRSREFEERLFDAELLRLQAELLLARGDGEAEAEDCLEHALEVARRQEARSLELRVCVSLGRLRHKQGERERVRETLSEIYNWFSEGFGSPDLKAAEALLAEV